MKIKFSLSGFARRSGNPFDIYSEEFRMSLVGVPVYLDRYKHVGRIVEVDPENDLIYAEVDDKEYERLILDAKGYNCCEFEIIRESGGALYHENIKPCS